MIPPLLVSLVTLAALLLPPAAAADAAGVRVVNGDFTDLAGLVPLEGHGWYSGVPAGWKSDAERPLYAVHAEPTGQDAACNVSQLGSLEQAVGTLTEAADVALTMDVADAWQAGGPRLRRGCHPRRRPGGADPRHHRSRSRADPRHGG